jgi:murein DD-endopeptidase MepM/ murein hydrolase activator NlpD
VQGVPIPALGAATTPYRIPVERTGAAGWGHTHAEYPASDVFVGCGAVIVSPVNGVVVESRRVNSYVPSVDDPATRGGRSVTIVGDDGVRYYMAHFEAIDDGIEPGVRVASGQRLGLMGQTGRASACHLHFGISPPCPDKEWSVRRGVVWPYPYLDDWRAGGQLSPVAEIEQWLADHPTACADAMADPHAPNA